MKKIFIIGFLSIVIFITILLLLPMRYTPAIASEAKCQAEINAISLAIQVYKDIYEEGIIKGDNANIIQCLTGKNKRKTEFIRFPPSRFNSKGEILDNWGVPFKISVNNEEITIVSAGKNKKFGDSDDIVPTPQPDTNPKP